MLYSYIRTSIVNFSKDKNVKHLYEIELEDIFTVALNMEHYDVLIFIKTANLEIGRLNRIVTFHFRQALIEENEKVYKFIYEHFSNYIDWFSFYPVFEDPEDKGIYDLLNENIVNGGYYFLKNLGFTYDCYSDEE